MRSSIEEESSCLFSVPKYHNPAETKLGGELGHPEGLVESNKEYYQIGFGTDT